MLNNTCYLQKCQQTRCGERRHNVFKYCGTHIVFTRDCIALGCINAKRQHMRYCLFHYNNAKTFYMSQWHDDIIQFREFLKINQIALLNIQAYITDD